MSGKCVACAKPETRAQEFICPECLLLIQLRGDLFVPIPRRQKCSECEFVCGGTDEMMIHLNTAHPLKKPNDAVNHPSHYTSHPSGVECIQVTEHLNFCVGNAIKYLWRAGSKGSRIEDLRKAKWYIERELSRLEAAKL